MPMETAWLTPGEDRAWRAFVHANHQIEARLRRHLLQDSGLTEADYVILAVLSEHPTGCLSAQELCTQLAWEKSRLSHQVRRMQNKRLIARAPNPTDARSVMISLLPAGRRVIEDAAPQHVHNVRRHLIDLFTSAELETLAALNERILHHLAQDPFPDQSTLDNPGPRAQVPADRDGDHLAREAETGKGRGRSYGRRPSLTEAEIDQRN